MTVYLIKLRQNIFEITLTVAFLLGLSLAYFLSIVISFFLQEPVKATSTIKLNNAPNYSRSKESQPEQDIIINLATGNLLRGTPKEQENDKNATPFNLEGITLIGILAGSPWYARASILIKGEKGANSYAINDTVSGAKIVAININAITVENSSGSHFEIYLNNDNDATNPNSNISKNTRTVKGAKVEKIVMNRDRFLQLINKQEDLFKLKFAPAIEAGKIRGWRLLSVPSDHFFYSMGVRSGDIIRRYNGQELINQDRMISMWQSLKTANQISVDIDRGGKIITFDITVQ